MRKFVAKPSEQFRAGKDFAYGHGMQPDAARRRPLCKAPKSESLEDMAQVTTV